MRRCYSTLRHQNSPLRIGTSQPFFVGRCAAGTMKRSGIAPVVPPPGGRKHQISDDSIPALIHVASPDCHNDHASEGAALFRPTLWTWAATFRRVGLEQSDDPPSPATHTAPISHSDRWAAAQTHPTSLACPPVCLRRCAFPGFPRRHIPASGVGWRRAGLCLV
jgi:hypothetical protein